MQSLPLLGQDRGLQDVHELGDVRHEQLVGLSVERIQRQPGHQPVAQRVLLPQERRVPAGTPGSERGRILDL